MLRPSSFATSPPTPCSSRIFTFSAATCAVAKNPTVSELSEVDDDTTDFSTKVFHRICLISGPIRLSWLGYHLLLSIRTISVLFDGVLLQPLYMNNGVSQGSMLMFIRLLLITEQQSLTRFTVSLLMTLFTASFPDPRFIKPLSTSIAIVLFSLHHSTLFSANLCQGLYQPFLGFCPFCFTRVSLFSSMYFWLCSSSFHWVTSITGLIQTSCLCYPPFMPVIASCAVCKVYSLIRGRRFCAHIHFFIRNANPPDTWILESYMGWFLVYHLSSGQFSFLHFQSAITYPALFCRAYFVSALQNSTCQFACSSSFFW